MLGRGLVHFLQGEPAAALRCLERVEPTVTELMGMQVQARLVVLSACETGRGKTTGGDDAVRFFGGK